jgi:hypothetical protein
MSPPVLPFPRVQSCSQRTAPPPEEWLPNDGTCRISTFPPEGPRVYGARAVDATAPREAGSRSEPMRAWEGWRVGKLPEAGWGRGSFKEGTGGFGFQPCSPNGSVR